MIQLLEQLANLDTASVSDALDSLAIEGVLVGLKPLYSNKKIFGPVFTVQYTPYEQKPLEFKSASDYIDEVPSGAIILIDNEGREDCSCWGDILTKMAQKKNIQGTLINGSCRDIGFIKTNQYPVYSKSFTMRSGKNRVYKQKSQCVIKIGFVTVSPGDIIMADEDGALVIPANSLEEIIKRAQAIKMTEEQIVASLDKGLSLKASRSQHRYDMPWLSNKEKHICKKT